MDGIINRTAENCYFRDENKRNKCDIVRDEYPCCPKTCKWHRTQQEMLESLYKAATTYERATGRDDYVVKFCPAILRAPFIEFKAKRKREEYAKQL